MNRSVAAVATAGFLALGFLGCPPSPTGTDGGPFEFDAGNPPPVDGCSGGCAVNQFCDPKLRICKDGCGGCDGGICTKTPSGQFQCVANQVTCMGTTCEQGEVACISGSCACLGPSRGTVDSCFIASGQACRNNLCRDPRQYDECSTTGAPCGTGNVCNPVFGQDLSICTKNCMTDNDCNRGENCSSVGCLPLGLFNGGECEIQVDGGLQDAGIDAGLAPFLRRIVVPVANKCLLKDNMGSFTETSPTGNCAYATFIFKDQLPYAVSTCRPPGAALENTECKQDWATTQIANQCSSGLECALTRGNDRGVCLRACNSRPPSLDYPNPTPGCNTGEACVNIYRRDDVNNDSSVLGVCMKTCNSFDGTKNSCANYAGIAASCVPTSPDGRLLVSSDGSGVCVPQQQTVAQVDQPCTETDAFKGATCGNNQVCAPPTATEPSFCRQVCDTDCIAGDAGVPARCATEPNATCSGGKTCKHVTTTTGAHLGFCR